MLDKATGWCKFLGHDEDYDIEGETITCTRCHQTTHYSGIPTACANCNFRSHCFGFVCWHGAIMLLMIPLVPIILAIIFHMTGAN